jgi:hypothetical protein
MFFLSQKKSYMFFLFSNPPVLAKRELYELQRQMGASENY